jgi:dimethylargininase
MRDGPPVSSTLALTRDVSPALARCELTHLPRTRIDPDVARAQHRAYEDRLTDLGCILVRLPADPDLPDSVFVEDTCVLLDEVAVIARPGAESRRAEVNPVAEVLGRFRELRRIEAPGTLDGGDVLCLGRTVHLGLSGRTNPSGAEQLRAILAGFGYAVQPVEVTGCLHLKTAVSRVSGDAVLVNPAWVDPAVFAGWEAVEVDPAEPHAANALLVGQTVIHPASFPRTRARLTARGIRVEPVNVAELAKAEAGVTCCCVLIRTG